MDSVQIANQGLCALEIAPNGIACAVINNTDNPEIEFCNFYPCNFGEQLPAAHKINTQLTSIVKEHNLSGMRCIWVLHPNFYRITLVDPPNVPRAEYKQAIRWQIKDLISYPLEDTAIEIFYPNDDETSPKKIYVLATQSSFLQKVYSAIQDCELELTVVDTREFVMRNLFAKTKQTNITVGLLNIVEESCLMVIVKSNKIQFVRRFPVDLEGIKNGITDGFVAEIQKSFNYCLTELQQELPTKLVVMPEACVSSNEIILKTVAQNLNQELIIFNLQETIDCKTDVTPIIENCGWPAIGGTLRDFVEKE